MSAPDHRPAKRIRLESSSSFTPTHDPTPNTPTPQCGSLTSFELWDDENFISLPDDPFDFDYLSTNGSLLGLENHASQQNFQDPMMVDNIVAIDTPIAPKNTEETVCFGTV